MNSRGKGKFGGNDGIPHYVKLSSLFRELIEHGEWPVGSRIPALPELQQTYGFARATIRQAIGILQDQGFLDSQRGRGTFVIKSPVDRSAAFLETTDDKLNLDPRFSIKIIGYNECSRDFGPARFIPKHEGTLISIKKLHQFKGEPFSLIEFIMPKRYFEMIPPGADKDRLYAQLIRDYTGLKSLCSEQVMTVILARHEVSELLEISVATPVVCIDATLTETGKDAPVMAHRSSIRSDLFMVRRRIENILDRPAEDWRPTVL